MGADRLTWLARCLQYASRNSTNHGLAATVDGGLTAKSFRPFDADVFLAMLWQGRRKLRRHEPDRERIVRLNRINIWLAGMQGLMQIAIILVIAKYVS
jgi:hypothetical protein